MTTLELKLNLPDRLAREAQAAGLLTPEALSQMLKDAMRRRAGHALLAGADRIISGDEDLLTLRYFQGIPITTTAQALRIIEAT